MVPAPVRPPVSGVAWSQPGINKVSPIRKSARMTPRAGRRRASSGISEYLGCGTLVGDGASRVTVRYGASVRPAWAPRGAGSAGRLGPAPPLNRVPSPNPRPVPPPGTTATWRSRRTCPSLHQAALRPWCPRLLWPMPPVHVVD